MGWRDGWIILFFRVFDGNRQNISAQRCKSKEEEYVANHARKPCRKKFCHRRMFDRGGCDGRGWRHCFGRANPAKVAAAGSKSSKFKVRFNDDLIHDLRVLKVAAINAKHKTVGKFSSLASKFKSGKQLKASPRNRKNVE